MCEIISGIRCHLLTAKCKIVITGTGMASMGSETLLCNILYKSQNKREFLDSQLSTYYVAQTADIIENKASLAYDRAHFHAHPKDYVSSLNDFVRNADVLIADHAWECGEPILLSEEMVKDRNRRLSVISDVVADIGGSLCTTLRHSSHSDPFYDVTPDLKEQFLFLGKDNISVCAVDTLPNALPKEASTMFSNDLVRNIIENCLLGNCMNAVDEATIIKKGRPVGKGEHLTEMLAVQM